MLNLRAVIQSVQADTGSVRVFQNLDLTRSWSFDVQNEKAQPGSDGNIFPFVVDRMDKFQEVPQGFETKVVVRSNGTILFADDYGVPRDFMIAVLFPQSYTPEVFKFKPKPVIPTGMGLHGASVSPPGHFEVLVNPFAKRSAVVFHITNSTFFGFKCLASPKLDTFPSPGPSPFLSDLYATLGFSESHPTTITVEELAGFGNAFKSGTDLDEAASAINRLLLLAHSGDQRGLREARSISSRLQDALGAAASSIQLSDSYLTGGTVARLLAYLAL
jgi:hypothetical protein